MNYATIKYYDIANGPGVRTSVFVSGCRHHCPGCFNAVSPSGIIHAARSGTRFRHFRATMLAAIR